MSMEELRKSFSLNPKATSLRESTFKVMLNIFVNGSQTKYDLEGKKSKDFKVCKAYVYEAVKKLTDCGFIEAKIDGTTRSGQEKKKYTLTHAGFCTALNKHLNQKKMGPLEKLDENSKFKGVVSLVKKWCALDPIILGKIDLFEAKMGREQTEDFLECYSYGRPLNDLQRFHEKVFFEYFRRLKWNFDVATEEDTLDVGETASNDFWQRYVKASLEISKRNDTEAMQRLNKARDEIDNWLSLLNSDVELQFYGSQYIEQTDKNIQREVGWINLFRKRINHDYREWVLSCLFQQRSLEPKCGSSVDGSA